jgi:hypothetical protein
MNTPAPAMAAAAWAQHLAAAPPPPPPRLSPQEAQRVQRYQERMLAALQTRDRCALRATQQEVLRSAYAARTPPALRQALRLLVWQMAAWLPLRQNLYETRL